MQVIPSINCHCRDFECVEDKVRRAEKMYAELPRSFGAAPKERGWIHLDIADGLFTFNKSWNDPPAWAKLKTSLKLEVHLMAEDAEELAHEWLAADAKRIIVHAETVNVQSADRILALAKKYGAQVMLTTNPETNLKSFTTLIPKFTMHQVLAVEPGQAGQKFLPRAVQKIVAMRRMFPEVTIEVDGGINEETARIVKDAGADIIIAATYIYGSENPTAAYQKLENV